MKETNETQTIDTAAAQAEAGATSIVIVDGKAKVADLRPHPENVRIYGDKDSVADLVKSIKESGTGILEPLRITPSGEIIGGHRRYRAALEVGLEEIPVRVFEKTDELEILMVLLGLNRQRVKTGIQIAKEAELQTRLRKQLREREKQQRAIEGENLPPEAKGKLRDEVALELGMSGRTVDKAVKAVTAADKLRDEGKEDDAQEVEAALNKSIEAGLKVAVKKGAVAAPKPKKHAKPEASATTAAAVSATVGDQNEKNVSAAHADTPSATPTDSTLDSDTALTQADYALSFLRSESAKAMNDKQRRDWTKVLNQITNCQAALNL